MKSVRKHSKPFKTVRMRPQNVRKTSGKCPKRYENFKKKLLLHGASHLFGQGSVHYTSATSKQGSTSATCCFFSSDSSERWQVGAFTTHSMPRIRRDHSVVFVGASSILWERARGFEAVSLHFSFFSHSLHVGVLLRCFASFKFLSVNCDFSFLWLHVRH